MKKNVVKINENTLRKIVSESVKRVLRESSDDYLDTELKEIWNGIQRIGSMQGDRIKDGMRQNGQESLIPKYEMLEKLADKMRGIMREMFDEIGSDWGTPKPQPNTTYEKGEFSGFGTDGVRSF